MTVNDVYTLALSFLPEDQSDNVGLKTYVPGWINILLLEALPYENTIRAAEGRPELERAPRVSGFSDELPYSQQISELAIPYGLASFIFKDDDDNYFLQDFRARYINALNEAKRDNAQDILDVYGGGE